MFAGTSTRSSPGSRASLLALLLIGAGLALGGCSVKRNLDSRVQQLLTALQRQDYGALRQIMQPQLYEQISAKAFQRSALMVKELGPLQQRRLAGLWLSGAGDAKGTYVLSFSKGTLEMRLELQNGLISALAWGGEGLDRAEAQLARQGFGRLLVREIAFLDQAGAVRQPRLFLPGEPISFRVSVKGLAVEGGRAHLALSVLLVDALGKAVLDAPRFAEKEIPLGSADPPVAALEGALPALKVGTYSFQVTVSDLVRSATAEEKALVQVAAGTEHQQETERE